MPSSGNFGTWNGAEIASYLTLTKGNAKVLGNTSTDASGINLNFGVNSGKWYVEFYLILSGSNYPYVGLSAGPTSQDFAASNTGYNGDIRYHAPNSTGMGNNTGSAGISNQWGTITVTETGVDACSNGDVVGFALDMDNKKLFISRNGTFFNSGNPAAGTYPQATWTVNPQNAYINCFTYTSSRGCIVNCGQDSTFSGAISAGGNADDNGFGDFKYAPPSGFLAISTANLPISADIDPAQTSTDFPQKQFNVVTYTGTGSNGNNITGLGFQPDLVWFKNRSNGGGAYKNNLADTNRGVQKVLYSDATNAEETNGDITSFDSDGFTVGGSGTYVNASSQNYVGWCWKANGGTTASNSDGDITSTVQANTKAGFSIVTYSGTLSGPGTASVGHGLTKKPDFLMSKARTTNTDNGNWHCSHVGLTSFNYRIRLNTDEAQADRSSAGDMASLFTSSTFGTNATSGLNTNGDTYVAYVWHNVEGMQRFGKYEGNANADGPFVYLGFRPRLLVIKNIDAADGWVVVDTARETFNPLGEKMLSWNNNNAEFDPANVNMDILSNGFKLRNTDQKINTSHTFVYMAWGDVPFLYNNAF